MTKQLGVCQECSKEYEYEYNPKYPRKYCPECSAAKKAAFNDMQDPKVYPVERPYDNATKPREIKPKTDRGFHLSPEEVRARALESAIKVTKKLGTEDYTGDLIAHAVEFERYINEGGLQELS
tara:strand:+ start:3583 stop:3951 length:369 start_codon:yes stop_codon:yes gene_type:complete